MIHYEIVGDIGVRVENPPLNATSQAVRAGLREAVTMFAEAPEQAAILCAAGKTFIAGADRIGLDRILDTITAAADDAFFWRPAPLLARMAADGNTFDTLNREEAP